MGMAFLRYRRWLRTADKLYTYASLGLVTVFVLLPFFWILSTSLKPESETFKFPVQWIPGKPTIAAYVEMWSHRPYGIYLLNSAFVALASMLIAVTVSSMSAYGLSRFRFRGSNWVLLAMMGTQMVPPMLLLISYFKVMSAAGLFDTLWALIITYTAYLLPFSVWIMKGYLDTIPVDLDEAALIDGCSPGNVFWRVILPVILPGIVATAIFSFLLAWNEFTFAYVLTSSDKRYTIGVGIAYLFGEYSVAWNELMAAGMVASLPPILLFFFASKYLISGLTAGALK
ncbi:carbohydrate ABC transporter permease [Geochorda subterranea]|uniref:Carbohydrate ABC transporter permease n=1 Tax=Geochorda subterranea TaxID=3109564 RepID=A0ABZ1BQY0_9FIRM|nr:carbohydrate ABC transporter permease [Limnochorda sp. LNt]WRP15139.1 carbohydrate ABC transporter permease [Limnochorda sp. LNt]